MHQKLKAVWLCGNLILFLTVLVNYLFAGTFILIDYLALIPQIIYLILSILLFLSGIWLYGSVLNNKVQFLPIVTAVCTVMLLIDLVFVNFSTATNSGSKIKIFSWNTDLLDSKREGQLIDQIKKVDADIVLLQEIFPSRIPGIKQRLTSEFPEYNISHLNEFVTMSKFPIDKSKLANYRGFSKTVVKYYDRGISLYNVHFKIPLFSNQSGKENFFVTRKYQFDELNSNLAKENTSFIAAGDFNSLRNYPFISSLESEYTMNQPTGLFVYPITYSFALPGIRIDYQFSNKSNRFNEYKTIGNGISDHFGIIGELILYK